VQQPSYTLLLASGDDLLGDLQVGVTEPFSLVSPLVQYADQIDHGIDPGELLSEISQILYVGLDQLGARQYKQVAVTLAPARQDPNPLALVIEPGH
jgi:hypothetical protein